MTMLTEFSAHPLVHALGWTLLHFFWQGAAIAGLLWCVLALLSGRSSQARYAASCFALLLLVALPLITFAHIAANEYRMRAELAGMAIPIDLSLILQVGAAGPSEPWSTRMAGALDHSLPGLLALWFAGVIFFVARLNFGLLVTRRLKAAGTETPPEALLQAFEALRVRLGIERAVRLLHSARVQVPTVIGWLRPVVLLPAGCLTGLSMDQVEAIFCHELAHVRRHDYLVSVFQSVAEALLFYHPAVWWVSKQVRRERECCCDEVAVAHGGDVLAYAKALSYLEERRASFPEFVLGANGGVLTMRIKRLLGCKENTATSQFAAFTVLVVLLAVAGSYAVTTARAQTKAPLAAAAIIAPVNVSDVTQGNPSTSIAQEDASIAGTIVDPSGAVVPRAQVKAINAQTSVVTGKETDASGNFLLSPLSPGTYTIEVMAPGFQRLMQQNVRIEVGQKVGLNLQLQVGKVNERLTVTGTPATAPAPPPPPVGVATGKPDGPARVSAGVMAGLAIAMVHPVYPAEAKVAHVQGVVVLHAIISKTGEVENVQVVSGPPPLMVSSIDAVRQWKYKPYLLNGEPVEVETTININYTFDGSTTRPGQSTGDDAATSNQVAVTLSPQIAASKNATDIAGVTVRMIGGSVSSPVVIYQVDPEYSAEAKQAKFNGIVLLNLLVDQNGVPQNVHVLRGVGMGLDAKALEAVRQYRFRPAMENGKPVPVELNIEVNFQFFRDATPSAKTLILPQAGALKPVLVARLETLPFPFSRMIFMKQAETSQAAPVAPGASASQSVPGAQSAPDSIKSEHGLTEEQRRQLEGNLDAAMHANAEAAKRLNSPEFRKQIEDAQRQAADAKKRMDSPEFRKQMEDAKRQAMEAAQRMNTPEFRKQIEDAKNQAMAAAKQINSADFNRLLDDAKIRMYLRQSDLDSPEFRKDMEEVRRQINAAAEELREAGAVANPPAK